VSWAIINFQVRTLGKDYFGKPREALGGQKHAARGRVVYSKQKSAIHAEGWDRPEVLGGATGPSGAFDVIFTDP
jgi:hypothetical protein